MLRITLVHCNQRRVGIHAQIAINDGLRYTLLRYSRFCCTLLQRCSWNKRRISQFAS
jgi:hypothetical protein